MDSKRHRATVVPRSSESLPGLVRIILFPARENLRLSPGWHNYHSI